MKRESKLWLERCAEAEGHPYVHGVIEHVTTTSAEVKRLRLAIRKFVGLVDRDDYVWILREALKPERRNRRNRR